MKKMMFALMSLLIFNISLFADAEYDIIPIVPNDLLWQCTVSSYEDIKMNNEFITGKISINDDDKVFIYHIKSQEFRILSELNEYAKITAIHENGIMAGIMGYYDRRGFVYDFHKDKLIKINSTPELRIRNLDLEALTITEDKKALFKAEENELGIIYDCAAKSITFLPFDFPIAANSKGQWIGGGYSWENVNRPSWFYDPETGFQEIPSLDKFNRWFPSPSHITEEGFVFGQGLDSHAKFQFFIWDSHDGKLITKSSSGNIFAVNRFGQAIGCKKDNAFIMQPDGTLEMLGSIGGKESQPYGINDHGVVVGRAQWKKYTDHPFIWDKHNGMRDLLPLISLDEGWRNIESVHDINNDGVIIGFGFYYGVGHYFILIPRNNQGE